MSLLGATIQIVPSTDGGKSQKSQRARNAVRQQVSSSYLRVAKAISVCSDAAKSSLSSVTEESLFAWRGKKAV
eukprot:887690-Amphidinium_carterae.1